MDKVLEVRILLPST